MSNAAEERQTCSQHSNMHFNLWDAQLQFQNSFHPTVTKRLIYGRHRHYVHGFKSSPLLHRILYLDFHLNVVFNERYLHVPNIPKILLITGSKLVRLYELSSCSGLPGFGIIMICANFH
jgi:hypothetical protein